MLPVVNRNWQSDPDALGGRWNLNANLLDIVREVGTQTRRMSLGAEWERTFRDGIGGAIQVYRQRARRRLFGQRSEPIVEPGPALAPISRSTGRRRPSRSTHNFLDGRVFPAGRAQMELPADPSGRRLTPLIEPIVAVYAAPNGGNQRKIPNEDSLSFEL